MCILIIDNTPTLVAYVGDLKNLSRFHFSGTTPTKPAKKRRLRKGAAPKKTAEQLAAERKQVNEKLKAEQARRETELETAPVIGSVERQPMLPHSTYSNGRRYKKKTIGIGKRQAVNKLCYDKKLGYYVKKIVMRCKDHVHKTSRVVSSKKPEYKDLRSTKFRVKVASKMELIVNEVPGERDSQNQ